MGSPYPHLLQLIMSHAKRFQLKRLALAVVRNKEKPIHFAMAGVVSDIRLCNNVISMGSHIVCDIWWHLAC